MIVCVAELSNVTSTSFQSLEFALVSVHELLMADIEAT